MSFTIPKEKYLLLILCIAAFFVYANSLFNDFVWDDEEQVVNNTVIRDFDNLGMVFTSSTFYAGGAGLSGGFYRPLVTLSYFINYRLWGLNPAGFRAMQLLFHIANVLLLYFLIKIIVNRQKISGGVVIAFFTALLFAIHPVNVESIVYVGSIGEVMYVFCVLLAAIFFIKSFDGQIISSRKKFALAFLMIFIGLLAKETAIIGLFLLLLYLLLLVRPKPKIIIYFFLACAVTIAIYLFLRLGVAKIAAIPNHYAPIYYAPLWQRLITVPYEIVSYLGMIFFPNALSISRHFVVASFGDPRFWLSLILLFIMAVAILFYIRKTRSTLLLFFLLWFGVALAPELNIIPLDMTLAERWLYLPIIGILAAVSLAVIPFFKKLAPKKRKIAAVTIIILLLMLAGRTIARNENWKSGLTLYSHDAAMEPQMSPQGSFDLENNFGVELFRVGKIKEAGEHFAKSIALQPKWSSSQNNLGAVLEHEGDLGGALRQYEKSIAVGNYYLAYENKAGILIKTKKYEEAKTFLEESLKIFPANANLQFKLAYLYAADNIGNPPGSKQKAVYILENILSFAPQSLDALRLYQIIESRQKIEL